MGRHPLGTVALTNAERQKLYRARLKRQGLVSEYVNKDLRGDYFDIEARLSMALSLLISNGDLSEDIKRNIVHLATHIIPPLNRVDTLFIEKKILNYLDQKGD